MNHTYLMQYISYHLHTFVRQYSLEYELLESFCGCIGFHDIPVAEDVFSLFHDDKIPHNTPVLLSVSRQIAYSLIPTPEHFYIIGPVRFPAPVYFQYHKEMGKLEGDFLQTVPNCEFDAFVNDVLLAYNLYRNTTMDKNSLLLLNCIDPETEQIIQKHFSELVFENREYGKTHNPYDQELREFSSIEHGDMEQLKKSIEEDYTGEVGTLAKNPLRQAKNLSIVVVTLASRAAMRGGLLPEISYSLSDSYIQKIEECDDLSALGPLAHSAEFQYTQMVHELLEQKKGTLKNTPNPHINKCKDYIFSHLHDKIYVKDIAKELQINANYLSELFHKCEKISLNDYILTRKIDLVKNLLIYSQYSYIEIAAYLSFSSQSHLGKQFKRITGYTLKQYRQIYGVKNFTTTSPDPFHNK